MNHHNSHQIDETSADHLFWRALPIALPPQVLSPLATAAPLLLLDLSGWIYLVSGLKETKFVW
jgi:hypothetical protein